MSTAEELVIPVAADVVAAGAAAKACDEIPNKNANNATRKIEMNTQRPQKNYAETVIKKRPTSRAEKNNRGWR